MAESLARALRRELAGGEWSSRTRVRVRRTVAHVRRQGGPDAHYLMNYLAHRLGLPNETAEQLMSIHALAVAAWGDDGG